MRILLYLLCTTTFLSSKLKTKFEYKKKQRKKEIKKRNGDFQNLGLFCLSECLSGNNLKVIQHYIHFQVCIKRCHVWKILDLVHLKACWDGEAHRHYTLILGHQGLLHSWARGWNHSVTSCKHRNKQRKKKKHFLVNLLTWVLCRWWSRSTKRVRFGRSVQPLCIHSTGRSKQGSSWTAFYSTDIRPKTAITQTVLFNKSKQGNKWMK